jgi:16S rRNA (cytidine1402-2'-O)-methyltransferase
VRDEILAGWGDRQLAFGRELTKLHEEFWRGSVSQAISYLKENPPRGEFVLVIAQAEEKPPDDAGDTDPLDMVKEKIAKGVPKKEALSEIAKQFKIPKRDLYNRLIQEQEKE